MEGLSINNVITNEDIVITYTPSSNVINYSYVIIKDNNYGIPINMIGGNPATLILKEEGSYKVEISSNGVIINEGYYTIDKTAPILNLKEKTYTITTKESFKSDIATASDSKDGDLTNFITTDIDSIDFTVPGIKKVEYSVSDKAGNITTDMVYVTVKKDNTSLIQIGQVSLILIMISIILFLIKYIKSIRLEKRFSKYTINSSLNKSISLFDNLDIQYDDFINKMSNKLSKINIMNNISKKYSKYITPFNLNQNTMNVVSNKIVLGFVFVFIMIIINLFRSKLTQPVEMLLPFILGYFVLDII